MPRPKVIWLRDGRHRGWVPTAVMCVAVSLALSSCTSRRLHESAHASGRPATTSEQAANALWTKNVRASREVPISATATIQTYPASGKARVRVFRLLEGPGGRYRLKYTDDQSSRGRVVISDGHHIWQYEPRTSTVVRRSAPAGDNSLDDSTSDGWKRELGATADVVDGRSASVLVLKGRSGAVVERRWIDEETGRALRIEEYDAHGRTLRRVTLSDVIVRPAVSDQDFQPQFKAPARHLVASSQRRDNLTSEARDLGLPVVAGHLRLRSVVKPARQVRQSGNHSTQCLYSDGLKSISIFVKQTGDNTKKAKLAAADEWHSVRIPGTDSASARQDDDGHAAVSWIHDRNHYTAVARMPVSELISAVENLAQ